jgi:tripartite-type tricarboxylate transporter receptor subunit TctC
MKKYKWIVVCVITALLFFALIGCSPQAEDTNKEELKDEQKELAYPDPNRAIEHIIPWSAGGGTDTAMRGFMKYAEKYVGTEIYNKNITGAQSALGVFNLMMARPDGYTIGTLTWDSVITAPYYGLVENYNLDKLEIICSVTVHPTSLVVRKDAPWKDLKEFIEDAKSRPGEIKVANVGTGGVWHLPMLDAERKMGIKLRHIAYPKGAGPQREALLSGEVDAACMSIAAAVPALKSGDARILAVMSEEREKSIPDAPTFKEMGYDVVWGSFRVVAVPAGTPKEIIEHLEKAFEKTMNDKEFQAWAKKTALGQKWMGREKVNLFLENTQKSAFQLMDELVKAGVLEPPK